jgi:predicted ATPase
MVCAVVITGAPGSGKSSVLDALATRLEIEGVAHGVIESEQLAEGVAREIYEQMRERGLVVGAAR